MQDYINYDGLLSKLSKKDLTELFLYLQNYQLSAKEILNVPEHLSFGIEIEFERLALEQAKKEISSIKDFKYWLVHEEKSVRDFIDGIEIGGEVSTDILHNTRKDWQKVFKLYRILTKLGAISTDKCALHIHIGAQIFGEDLEYLKRFIKVWCVFEDIIFRFGYHETSKPRNIEYMRIFCKTLAPIYREIIALKPKYFKEVTTPYQFNFGKTNAVAFHNFHYLSNEEEINNDIEVRSPNGTLNPLIVQNNINFFLHLCLYVTSESYDARLINRLFKNIGVKDLKEYSYLDFPKAILLSDLIFSSSQDKIDFLRGYVKDTDILTR